MHVKVVERERLVLKFPRRVGLIGLSAVASYRAYHSLSANRAERIVNRHEEEFGFKYEPELLYFAGGGGDFEQHGSPTFEGSPENKTTLLLFEGYRVLVAGAMHESWFTELMARGCNVLAPVLGVQSLPFAQRNLGWDFRFDMRQALQIFDAAVASASDDQRIVVVGSCFGALPALTVAALRKVDALVLVGPMTSGMGRPNRSTSRFETWLNGLERVDRLLPYFFRSVGEKGWGDIVNPDVRAAVARRVGFAREINVRQAMEVKRAVRHMEDALVPQLKDAEVAVIWGRDDRIAPPVRIERLADLLEDAGNRVERFPIDDCGHMVLLDNGRDVALSIIEEKLRLAPRRQMRTS